MTIRIVVGRTEGFVSSVGFISEGMPFLCRGVEGRGLHLAPKGETAHAITELCYLAGYLEAQGNVVEGLEKLDDLKKEFFV